MSRRVAAVVAGVALIAGCGGDDDGSGTPNADRVEDCLEDVEGHNLERTPGNAPIGNGADVEFLGQADGKPVSIYVAEGDTDPQAVYDSARDSERQRRDFVEESGEADDPDYARNEIVLRESTVFSFAETLDAEVRAQLEDCAV